MSTGFKVQQRHADAIDNTLNVLQIAMGEEPEDYVSGKSKKNEATASMPGKRESYEQKQA